VASIEIAIVTSFVYLTKRLVVMNSGTQEDPWKIVIVGDAGVGR